MTLNDGNSMIAGRKIQLDTANHGQTHNNNNHNNNNHNNNNRGGSHNRPSFDRPRGGPQASSVNEIDGSKFRGGRFQNQNNNNNNNNNNNDHHHHHNDRRSTGSIGNKDAAPSQRPSLKLAPRTKPREEKGGSASNIFGGAKARDEQAWEKKRTPSKPEKAQTKATEKAPSKPEKAAPKAPQEDGGEKKDINKEGVGQERRKSAQSGGRGGRGRGGGGAGRGAGKDKEGRGGGKDKEGRGGGKDKDNNNHRKGSNARRASQKDKDQVSPEEKAAAAAAAAAAAKPAAVPEPVKAAPAPKKEVTNKFALLMDSDSD
jgi:hypothetical protein